MQDFVHQPNVPTGGLPCLQVALLFTWRAKQAVWVNSFGHENEAIPVARSRLEVIPTSDLGAAVKVYIWRQSMGFLGTVKIRPSYREGDPKNASPQKCQSNQLIHAQSFFEPLKNQNCGAFLVSSGTASPKGDHE